MYKVLIADDREIFRRQLKRLNVFSGGSFTISYEAQNGEEALEILRSSRVDLVITDIRMPIMDGIELLQKIKEENLCRCVVFLSEYAEFSYARQGMLLGAFDYIVKPIDANELSELLKRAEAFLSDSGSAELAVTAAQIDRIAKFILSGDEYVLKMCSEIVGRMVKSAADDSVILSSLDDFLKELGGRILKEREYLRQLIDTERLFSMPVCERNRICSVLSDKIAEIMEQSGRFRMTVKNELIQSVCDSILKQLGKNISLQTMADLHFVNKAYLSHLFSQETGISFLDYVNRIKMEYAKRRLVCSSDKIYEIALELEYADTEYFSKVFKQYTGYNPSSYRQEFSSEDSL